MRSLHTLKKGLGAAVALAIVLAGLTPSRANALPFQYAAGDIVGVFNKGGTDLIVNFGGLPASGTTTKAFALPTQFGGTLAGATFNGAFRTPFDNNAFPAVIDFTTTSSLNFPDPTGQFADSLGAAQSSLAAFQTGWFAQLPLVPAPPAGGNVFNRGPDILALSAAASYSYTSLIGLGTDNINNTLTNGVNTRIAFGALTTASIPFYQLTYDFNQNGDSVYSKSLLGTFTATQSGSDVSLAFAAIPEPGTLLLVASGLIGLGVSGRKRSA
jgi:hypothetical protein